MISHPVTVEDAVPRRYPPEFRRKVLDLVAAGRPVAQVASDLAISAQVIYTWRRQHLIDTGQMPVITSRDQAELVAARKRLLVICWAAAGPASCRVSARIPEGAR